MIECGIKPILVFDGARHPMKAETHKKRDRYEDRVEAKNDNTDNNSLFGANILVEKRRRPS